MCWLTEGEALALQVFKLKSLNDISEGDLMMAEDQLIFKAQELESKLTVQRLHAVAQLDADLAQELLVLKQAIQIYVACNTHQ